MFSCKWYPDEFYSEGRFTEVNTSQHTFSKFVSNCFVFLNMLNKLIIDQMLVKRIVLEPRSLEFGVETTLVVEIYPWYWDNDWVGTLTIEFPSEFTDNMNKDTLICSQMVKFIIY